MPARKTTGAKAAETSGETKAETTAKSPAVDLAALVARATESKGSLPKIVRSGQGAANPFEEQIRKSFETGKPWDVPITADEGGEAAAKKVRSIIRRGAAQLGYGCSVRIIDEGDGDYVVAFQAREKQARDE